MPLRKQRRKNRDSEKLVSREEFVIKLRRLADALEAGKPFVIQVANERITVPLKAEDQHRTRVRGRL